jgi:subtilase family serine protease
MRPTAFSIAFGALAALAIVGIAFGNANSADTTILVGNHPREAETLPPVGAANPSMPLTMEIRFAPRNQAEMNQLLTEQQTPGSPNFHRWLKSGEYDQRFGPRQSDIGAVAEWLRRAGFTIVSTGGYIQFSGTVAQAERAFDTRIERFGDGSTYANVSDPAIPARFVGVIGNILGLDNMMHAVPVGPSYRAPAKP